MSTALVLMLSLLGPPSAGELRREAASDSVVVAGADSLAAPTKLAPIVLEPVPDTTGVYRAPLIEVRAARIDRQQLLDRMPLSASVLEASSWSGGVSTTSEALRGAVGVNVRESGGIGSYSTVSLRGASASQVPIFLDGVPLNGAGQGEVDLADIPLSSLERIEVYRGAAPLMLGGGSLGGAIHCFSARAVTPPWLRAARGSHGTFELQGGGGLNAGLWTLAARARGVQSEGDWGFADDRGTLYNQEDDVRATRVNNDVRGGGLLLSARRPFGVWMFGASGLLDGREQGVPGYSIDPAHEARSRSLTGQLRLSLERPRATPWGAEPARDGSATRARSVWLRGADVYLRHDGQGFRDRLGELGLGAADREDRTRAAGAAVWGEWRGPRRWALDRVETGWRLEAHLARLRSQDHLAAASGEPQTRRTLALGLQPVGSIAEGRAALLGGARVEVHQDRFHGVPFGAELPTGPADHSTSWTRTLQLGGRVRLGDSVDIRANLGLHERIPTLLERFGARGTVVGNPALQPESGVNRDVGVVWSHALVQRVAVNAFHNNASDLIAFVRNSQRTVVPLNIGAAQIRGLEVELALGAPGVVTWQGNFTRLQTRDRTNHRVAQGKQLPGRPGHELDLRVTLGGAGRIAGGWTLSALGEDFLDRANRDEVPSRVLHGLFVDLPLPWPASPTLLQARIDNLGDSEVFDLAGWPLPGRTFHIAISLGGHHER